MNICVVGYYFNREFYDDLLRLPDRHKVFVVCHRQPPRILRKTKSFDFVRVDNIGLEFHAYNFYLQKIWDQKSSVLFMHDDMIIEDLSVFDQIELIKKDCAYIFRDQAEADSNGGKHGRAIFISKVLLAFIRAWECKCEWCEEKSDPHRKGETLPKIKAHKGFWFDPANKGHVSGSPPIKNRHYNSAIEHFHWFLGRVRDQRCGDKSIWPNPKIKMDVVNRLFFSDIVPGRRNCWKHVDKEIEAYKQRQLNVQTINNSSSIKQS